MSRNLYLEYDPDEAEIEATVENLWPYNSVSVKTHNVITVAEAAESLNVDASRFREFMRRPAAGDGEYGRKSSEGTGSAKYEIPPHDVDELCEFARENEYCIELSMG